MSRRATVRPSALRVVAADGKGGIINVPSTLYFFMADGWTAPIPPDQEAARQELEHFSSILRLIFKSNEVALDKYFAQLVSISQGAFSADGFRAESLNSLTTLKDEVVRLVGPQLKHDYLKRLAKGVGFAFFGILLIAVVIDQVVKLGVATGRVVETSVGRNAGASPGKDENQGQGPKREPETREFALGGHIRWDGNFSILHIGLLLAFSMVGLLFASMTRNLVPRFDNLLTPDADLMYPWIKLTYYGIAISIMGFLFEERWVAVSLGERFSTAAINENAVAAIVFGLLLGIAERLVPREVARYATEVVMRSSMRQPPVKEKR